MEIEGNDILFNLYGYDGEKICENCIPYHIAQTLIKRKVCEYVWDIQGIKLYAAYEDGLKKIDVDSESLLLCHLMKNKFDF